MRVLVWGDHVFEAEYTGKQPEVTALCGADSLPAKFVWYTGKIYEVKKDTLICSACRKKL